jgi:hypothetical protein
MTEPETDPDVVKRVEKLRELCPEKSDEELVEWAGWINAVVYLKKWETN